MCERVYFKQVFITSVFVVTVRVYELLRDNRKRLVVSESFIPLFFNPGSMERSLKRAHEWGDNMIALCGKYECNVEADL